MKNKKVKKAIAALGCFSILSFAAFAQVHEDIHVRWGEEDSTSYVEIVNGKFGIVMEGKRTLETKYDIENFEEAIRFDGNAYFYDGAAFVLALEGKWGVMNNRGKVILPFEYDYVRMERDFDTDAMAFAGVEKNGKVALTDGTGKLLTGFVFDAFYGYYLPYGMRLSSPKLAMKQGEKIVFYDPETKKIIKEAPEQEFGVEVKVVYYKNKAGVISRTGEIILPVEYDAVYAAETARLENRSQPILVRKDGKAGVFRYGKGMIIPVQYAAADAVYVNETLLFLVFDKNKYAIYNADGKALSEFIYDGFVEEKGVLTGQVGHINYIIAADGSATPIKK